MANAVSSKVVDSKNFVELDDLKSYDYEATKNNVDRIFAKYRNYKEKKDIIIKRTKSSLSFDNLGIYGSSSGDPISNKMEQIERYDKYLNTIDDIYNLYSEQLSKDEKIIYKKMLLYKYTDEEVMQVLNISSKNGLYIRKRSCYIKVARWFDLEVYS